jgi:hypothetical protein
MVDGQLPYVLANNNFTTAIVVTSGSNALFFDNVTSNPTPRFFIPDQLAHANGEFILTDSTGEQLHFYDFTGSPTNPQWGKFKSEIDADGNVTAVTSWTSDGKQAEVQRSTPAGQTPAVTESYLYSYLPAGDPNAGLLSSVNLRRGPSPTGPWTTVRQVVYDYLTAADSVVAPYADNAFTYDSSRRVITEVAQGDGSSASSGGLGTYQFSYATNPQNPPSGCYAGQLQVIPSRRRARP